MSQPNQGQLLLRTDRLSREQFEGRRRRQRQRPPRFQKLPRQPSDHQDAQGPSDTRTESRATSRGGRWLGAVVDIREIGFGERGLFAGHRLRGPTPRAGLGWCAVGGRRLNASFRNPRGRCLTRGDDRIIRVVERDRAAGWRRLRGRGLNRKLVITRRGLTMADAPHPQTSQQTQSERRSPTAMDSHLSPSLGRDQSSARQSLPDSGSLPPDRQSTPVMELRSTGTVPNSRSRTVSPCAGIQRSVFSGQYSVSEALPHFTKCDAVRLCAARVSDAHSASTQAAISGGTLRRRRKGMAGWRSAALSVGVPWISNSCRGN